MDNKKVLIWVSIAGALSGVVALISYLENRKKNKLQQEIYGLDKQIKMLDLEARLNNRVMA